MGLDNNVPVSPTIIYAEGGYQSICPSCGKPIPYNFDEHDRMWYYVDRCLFCNQKIMDSQKVNG